MQLIQRGRNLFPSLHRAFNHTQLPVTMAFNMQNKIKFLNNPMKEPSGEEFPGNADPVAWNIWQQHQAGCHQSYHCPANTMICQKIMNSLKRQPDSPGGTYQ